MLDQALPNLDSWVSYFSQENLPILRRTARQLAAARENIDDINGRDIAAIVLQDPLLTVRVLAYIQPMANQRLRNDITTIDQAIVMQGVEPFFRRFENLPVVEDGLSAHPQALLGLLHTVRRAQRAARYANDWAYWRHDMNVEEVVVATLLHELAEILIWCFSPTLALRIKAMKRLDRNLRSAVAQHAVLGVTLADIQQALCRAWRLPELMITLTDDKQADHPRVRNVLLAINLARHSANGWDDAALPDDYKEIANLLHLNLDTVKKRIGVPEAVVETETDTVPVDGAPAGASPGTAPADATAAPPAPAPGTGDISPEPPLADGTTPAPLDAPNVPASPAAGDVPADLPPGAP